MEKEKEASKASHSKSGYYRSLADIKDGLPPGHSGRYPYLLPDELLILKQRIRIRTLEKQTPTRHKVQRMVTLSFSFFSENNY
jgi:hypothetical protein